MIIVRISRGIVDHFPVRVSEWIMTYALCGWGWVLCLDTTTFDRTSSLKAMAAWGEEQTWGTVMILAATLRFIALVVNGTFKTHFPYSPHMRGLTSLISCTVWGQITLGVLISYQAGGSMTGFVIYSAAMMLDTWNLFRAWADVGVSRAARGT